MALEAAERQLLVQILADVAAIHMRLMKHEEAAMQLGWDVRMDKTVVEAAWQKLRELLGPMGPEAPAPPSAG